MRAEWRDLVELVLLPGLAACLPWRVIFAIYRRAATWKWLYADACQAAQDHAVRLGVPGASDPSWLAHRRLVTLIDHADHYLGLTRGNGWITRFLDVTGTWPTATDVPMAMITFHWGAGYWGLRHAAQHGLHPHALMATLDSTGYQGRSVRLRYAKSRNANVEQVLGAAPIDAQRELRSLVGALRANATLLGVVDVPGDGTDASAISVPIKGRTARFAGGFLRRLAKHRIPVVLYITGVNLETGRRTLRIESIRNSGNVSELADDIFKHLDALLTESSAAWHFWSEAARIFPERASTS